MMGIADNSNLSSKASTLLMLILVIPQNADPNGCAG
jgi:hypothetical protein